MLRLWHCDSSRLDSALLGVRRRVLDCFFTELCQFVVEVDGVAFASGTDLVEVADGVGKNTGVGLRAY